MPRSPSHLRLVTLLALLSALSDPSALSAFGSQPSTTDPKPADTADKNPAPRRASLDALLENVTVLRDLPYATPPAPDDKPLFLDLYLPKNATKPTPLIIWVHGGGWRQGRKDFCPAVPFCKDGFAVCSIQYRLTDRAPFPAQIHDCKAAVRYLRANAKKYNLDPDRFGAWGASAGGHLVSLLGTTSGDKECEGTLGCPDQSSAVQCVCDWFGPTDFASFIPTADTSPMLVALFGGPLSEKPDLVKLASPLLHVTKDDAPFLIVQGDKDVLVPTQQSQVLHNALKKAGVESELVIVKDGGHGFGPDRNKEELERVRQFFIKQLKPQPVTGKVPSETTPAPASKP